MTTPEQLSLSVDYYNNFNLTNYELNEELGFFTDSTVANGGLVRVLGFGVPLSREGGFDPHDTPETLVHIVDLAPQDQTIDINGKGVGPRLYNTPAAAHGLKKLPKEFGAYTCDIKVNDLLDGRAEQGGRLAQIWRQAVLIGASKIYGTADAVERVHQKYKMHGAVLLGQPPHAALRQAERHAESPADMPAEFIILRDAAYKLQRVGTAFKSE